MRTFHPLWFALISVSAMPAGAAEAIGSIYSGGAYQMDGVDIRGNATLFDGSTLQIGDAAAQIHLANGAGMWLAPKSRATMTARGIRLLAGMGQFETPVEYRLEARAVRVAASQPHTTVRVALDENGGAIVAPMNGAVQVTNSRGTRVGELTQGNTVRFAGQAGAAAAVNVSGCLSRDRDQFTLTDAVTNVPVRLTGPGLGQEVGHVISVSGVEGAPRGDTTNVTVTGMRRLSPGSCTAAGAQGGGLMAMTRPLGIAAQLQTAGPRLMLLVVEGEGAINNIRQRTAREPIVEVQDENRKPVAGALVLFAIPRNGAGGTFADGSNTLRVTTDAQGRAVARGMKPNNVAGQFQIAVTASYGGLTVSIAIHQLNSLTAATTAGTSSAAAATSNARNGGALQADSTGGAASGDSAGTANAGGTGASGSGTGAGSAGANAGSGATGAGGAGGNAGAAGGAGGAGGSGGGASGAGVGMTVGTKVAIIGGVTATAVGGGLAAAGVFSGGTEPAVSR